MPVRDLSARAQLPERRRLGLWGLALAGWVGLVANAQVPGPSVEVRPNPPYVERLGDSQAVNFDFLVSNPADHDWVLQEIEVAVYDSNGRLQVRRSVNDNGNSPSVATMNRRQVGAGQKVLLFNPFHTFDNDLELSVLGFRFQWLDEKGGQPSSSEVRVTPVAYAPAAGLLLPLRARSIVWDGHDFYSHHRRFNYLSANAVAAGTRTNPDRYGHDLVPVNGAGEMYAGSPADNENWFGFGKPVFAVASGRVVAVFDAGLDNREVDEERFKYDKLADYGNYVVVDHGRGEFALYGHIKRGSARADRGDTVGRGQHIADIGASGSSLMPHLHFQLQSAADADSDGLPAYFTRYVRVLGNRRIPVAVGPIDSGDIIEPE